MNIIPIQPRTVATETRETSSGLFGRFTPSRRTFGKFIPSRRTFGRFIPSRRTFGTRIL